MRKPFQQEGRLIPGTGSRLRSFLPATRPEDPLVPSRGRTWHCDCQCWPVAGPPRDTVCAVPSCFSHFRLCNPMDYVLPGSSVHGISQARILEWVSMPSARGSSWPRDWTWVSYVMHWQVGSLLLAPPGKPPRESMSYQISFDKQDPLPPRVAKIDSTVLQL